ncbi:MAG: NfeD family protein [Micromonosporaceae bacterium]
MTTVFLIIGLFGLALLVASLVFGEVMQLGELDADGPFSVGALSAFVGAFGFGGAISSGLVAGLAGPFGLIASLCAGLAAGVPAAWLTIRFTRAAMNMRTDATLTRKDLIGTTGVVVTPVPADGYGEVRLFISGQQIKYNARADEPIPTGNTVLVVGTPSETSVVVEQTDSAGSGS